MPFQAQHQAAVTRLKCTPSPSPSHPRPLPTPPTSYDDWSNMLFNAGQRETAARVLQQGAHHNPRWFGGRLGAAIVLRDLGHTRDSIQLCVRTRSCLPGAAGTADVTYFCAL